MEVFTHSNDLQLEDYREVVFVNGSSLVDAVWGSRIEVLRGAMPALSCTQRRDRAGTGINLTVTRIS